MRAVAYWAGEASKVSIILANFRDTGLLQWFSFKILRGKLTRGQPWEFTPLRMLKSLSAALPQSRPQSSSLLRVLRSQESEGLRPNGLFFYLTFGTNRIPSVNVVQNKMTAQMSKKLTVGWLLVKNDTGTPTAHSNTTLYTLMPIKRESFSAGMETLRVSNARNNPKMRRRLWKV